MSHFARLHARADAARLAALASRTAPAAVAPGATAEPITSPDAGVAAGSASMATTVLAAPAVAPATTLDRLSARLIPLALSLPPDPAAPLLIEVSRSRPPLPLGSRWAVQLLAGPALTHRYLSPATPMLGTVPLVSPTSVAELERPALGYGAQASLRRTFSPHWNLSLGLGYAEYASALALLRVPLVPYITNPIDTGSVTRIQRRDTYRFVLVPLRVGYAVAPSARWRLGLLAGADAAIYAGGTSTEGPPCACQTQTWAATGPTPYRRLSLSLSLGLEARYRLRERWELLAQPTASYFPFALPRADAGAAYAQRHLWGGTLLLGISHDLR